MTRDPLALKKPEVAEILCPQVRSVISGRAAELALSGKSMVTLTVLRAVFVVAATIDRRCRDSDPLLPDLMRSKHCQPAAFTKAASAFTSLGAICSLCLPGAALNPDVAVEESPPTRRTFGSLKRVSRLPFVPIGDEDSRRVCSYRRGIGFGNSSSWDCRNRMQRSTWNN